MPGWRVGWLVLHDKGTGRLAELSAGIRSLSQIILGALRAVSAIIFYYYFGSNVLLKICDSCLFGSVFMYR